MLNIYSRLVCSLFAICLLPLGARAQALTQFSDKPDEFVNQLGDFMTASKRPDMEEAYQVFKKNYKTGAFSANDLQRVIKVANLLAGQKLSAFPYYKNYTNAV